MNTPQIDSFFSEICALRDSAESFKANFEWCQRELAQKQESWDKAANYRDELLKANAALDQLKKECSSYGNAIGRLAGFIHAPMLTTDEVVTATIKWINNLLEDYEKHKTEIRVLNNANASFDVVLKERNDECRKLNDKVLTARSSENKLRDELLATLDNLNFYKNQIGRIFEAENICCGSTEERSSEVINTLSNLRNEVNLLRLWKAQMIKVDDEWDKVRKLLTSMGVMRLGDSYAVTAEKVIMDQLADLDTYIMEVRQLRERLERSGEANRDLNAVIADLRHQLDHEKDKNSFQSRVIVNLVCDDENDPPAEAPSVTTPCCGYTVQPTQDHPVMWNPFNKVVQCHNCGHTYSPEPPTSNETP